MKAKINMNSKEFGSDFHFCSQKEWLNSEPSIGFFNQEKFSLFYSGRAALYNILALGIKTNQWEKVYIPSYYCHEVTSFLSTLPIQVLYYDYNPFSSVGEKINVDDDEKLVFVSVYFFGLKRLKLESYKKSIIIEDLTHSILSYKDSNADYCFASLRKELPVPIGGYCFSPKNLALPVGNYDVRVEESTYTRAKAMFLKEEYLSKNTLPKSLFRSIYIETENEFSESYTQSRISLLGHSLINLLNVSKIIYTKQSNTNQALSELSGLKPLKLNLGLNEPGFGLLLELEDNTTREGLKKHLIKHNIYPAILWPNQTNTKDKSFEDRVLFVHTDYRYNKKDINYITDKIKNFFL